MAHGCGWSEVNIRVTGRVVPVMHLIAFRLLAGRSATTTMEHRSGQTRQCSIVVVTPGRYPGRGWDR